MVALLKLCTVFENFGNLVIFLRKVWTRRLEPGKKANLINTNRLKALRVYWIIVAVFTWMTVNEKSFSQLSNSYFLGNQVTSTLQLKKKISGLNFFLISAKNGK